MRRILFPFLRHNNVKFIAFVDGRNDGVVERENTDDISWGCNGAPPTVNKKGEPDEDRSYR